jgi:hypothetical protein
VQFGKPKGGVCVVRNVCGSYLSVVESSEWRSLIMWFEVYTLLCDLVYANYRN